MVAVLIVPETGGKPALLLLIAPRALMVIIFIIQVLEIYAFQRAQAVLMLVEALAQIVLLTVLLALPVFTVLHVVVEIIYIIVPAFHPALVPPMLLVLVV